MRTIEFRGQRKDIGEWIYGSLIYSKESYYIQESGEGGNFIYPMSAEVIPETVGQFTGLADKDGKGIYEGDIVKRGYDNANGSFYDNYPIVYSIEDGAFMCGNHKRLTKNMIKLYSVEIIGNIHENPELMGGIRI